MWSDFLEIQAAPQSAQCPLVEDEAPLKPIAPAPVELGSPATSVGTPRRLGANGWPIPADLALDPDEARARIPLPEFDALMLEKARVISGHFPAAEARHRHACASHPSNQRLDLPHFERVFRLASALAGVPEVETATDYDSLLILTAWHCVRPGEEGYLGSYPKALLCPLSHCAPPTALATLPAREQALFDRRAPSVLALFAGRQIGPPHLQGYRDGGSPAFVAERGLSPHSFKRGGGGCLPGHYAGGGSTGQALEAHLTARVERRAGGEDAGHRRDLENKA